MGADTYRWDAEQYARNSNAQLQWARELPWGFYGPQEYRHWLVDEGLTPRRVELIPRDMRQNGRDGFLGEVADRFLALHPLTREGEAIVRMVRLEVEADKS